MYPFEYPDTPHARRHSPRGYETYVSFKPWLRDEFSFRCVYCLNRELWYPDGDAAFGVDHVQPQCLQPELVADYENLVYACNRCNWLKGDQSSFIDPCRDGLGRHVRVLESGEVSSVSPAGAVYIDVLGLNESRRIRYRRAWLSSVKLALSEVDHPFAARVLELLAFPDNLPNLAVLRPPEGNARQDGVGDSYYARGRRGLLAARY